LELFCFYGDNVWQSHKKSIAGGKTMEYSDLKTKVKGLTVQSLDGKNIPVESLWASHRIVLAFLRHFG